MRTHFKVNPNKSYFDKPAVIQAAGMATATQLGKAGSYIRRDARKSIRPGKKPSKPGRPPHGHGQQRLKEGIEFAWDYAAKCMVCGPAALNWVFFDGAGKPMTGAIPRVLEEGGDYNVLEVFNTFSKKWQRADLRSKRRLSAKKKRMRRVHIEARPYMRPAIDKNKDVLRGLFTDVPWAVKSSSHANAA
ncbi:MAG TPA: hypothetical protein VGH74_09445 [Planctomycetaceae bacterium]|jgi:hypothetical protein